MFIRCDCPHVSSLKGVFYKRSKHIISIIVILFLSFALSIFYVPVRNVVYSSYINPALQDLKTEDIIKIRFMSRKEYDDSDFVLNCDALSTPSAPYYDPFAGVNSSKCREGINNVTTEHVREMLSRGLGRYLPILTHDMRMSILRLYAVMSKALEGQGVLFFLTAGSLLGVIRHGGFVPWDDDFDIGIHFTNMSIVRNALGCIEGMEFDRSTPFHWKFHYTGQDFPFIDLFFYETDGRYVWTLTHYVTSTFVYPYEHVFPVKRTQFEGCLSVPIPGKGLDVLKRIYHYTECKAHNPHHNGVDKILPAEFPDGYSRTNVPCNFLVEFYKMNHLDE